MPLRGGLQKDATTMPESRQLEPLAYHREVVAQLKQHEAAVLEHAASRNALAEDLEKARAGLLRQTYRLDPQAFPDVHAKCGAAMAALEIETPVTLYQARDGA